MARLPRAFFARDSRLVARDLLGHVLVRVMPDGVRLSGRVVETEAYRPDDSASHSYRGRTERNAPMFMRPGTAYVYFTYGMHHCFNVSTEAEGVGAAVLIRALVPLEGVDVMREHRKHSEVHALCRGPGNLCKALAIDRTFSGCDLLHPDSPLFIERAGDPACLALALARARGRGIGTSPRIGVRGDETAKSVAWRYFLMGNASVSGRKAS